MPKLKTLKILRKKIKTTGKKKVKRWRAHRNHLMAKRRNVARKRVKAPVVVALQEVSTQLRKLIRAFNIK